jgi:predicted DNA-binding ribbon-helix-helix protein
MATLRKRSVLLAGHATSIALEPEFWEVLEEMARVRGLSLAALIVGIDRTRAARPLASACRVAALKFAQSHPSPSGEGQLANGERGGE